MSTDKKKASLSELIEAFDLSVQSKKYDTAVVQFSQLLNLVETGAEGLGRTRTDMTLASEVEATLLASAITNWLCDKEYVLTRNAFHIFTQYKRAISQIFEISGYRGTSHFRTRFGTRKADGKFAIAGHEVPKLFCGLSINAMNDQMVDLFLAQDPNMTWLLLLGFLSEQVVWSSNAEQARSRFFAHTDLWKDVAGEQVNVRNLGPAYMGCSYAVSPNKHDIKKAMNGVVRRWLQSEGITSVPQEAEYRGVKKKPTLIVAAELYDSTHAMHRCYGPAIRALKDRFKLVYMSLDGKCDPKLHYMFDKIDTTPFDRSKPKAFFDKMKSYRPDVIYYPSVGMRLLSIYGANLRIAPVQVMTYGHPATTHSEFIDYSLITEGQIGDEATIADKILYWYDARRYEIRHDAQFPKTVIRGTLDTVQIAVPAWSRKVTPQFLSVCLQIQNKSPKPVKFLFYPNGVGALYQAFKRRVETTLNAEVFPRTTYNDYLNSLKNCDIFLSTFPFGATNGILDAGPLGLPIVNLRGAEVHAMNDSEMVTHMKQPDWLSCETTDAYLKAVLRLINNDEERVAISQANAVFDYEAALMSGPDENCASFGVAVEAAYRHHATFQNSPDHAFSVEALSKLDR